MITINLVPENEKKEFQLLNIYIAIKNFVFLLLLGTVLSAIVLIFGKIILLDYLQKMLAINMANIASSKSIDIDIKNLNNEIKKAQLIQGNHIYWINFFSRFGSIINDGVIINSLKLSQNGTLEIEGMAKTRQNLMDFESNVANSGYFGDFKFPYETFFEKENIRFSIKLLFDPKTITSPSL